MQTGTMYEVPIRLMFGSQKYDVLEAGFGFGAGLDRMVESDVLASYYGYEPDTQAFSEVSKRYAHDKRITLENWNFHEVTPGPMDVLRTEDGKTFDHVFCIHVADFVPAVAHLAFFTALRNSTHGTLWFAAPDKTRYPALGSKTRKEWLNLLNITGFSAVTHHDEQWIDLYICQ